LRQDGDKMLSGNDSAMTLAEIQRAIEELPEDEQAALATWMAQRDRARWDEQTEHDLSPGGAGIELLRERRGIGGIHPDYDYKRLRSGKAQNQELDAPATAFQEEIGRRLASGPATPMDFSGVKKSIREGLEDRKGGRQ
jgi:hypothetical protein